MYKLKWMVNKDNLSAYYEPTNLSQIVLYNDLCRSDDLIIYLIPFSFASSPTREPLLWDHRNKIERGGDYV